MTGEGKTWARSATSWRTEGMPVGWEKLRARVLQRDGHQCTWTDSGYRCPVTEGLEVDHMNGASDHSLDSLRTLCRPHHRAATARQASAARQAKARARQQPQRRHPGLLP